MDTLIFIITALLAFGLGMFIYHKPLETFEIQKRFYRLINWHIEPISLDKEIRNTKIMGGFLILLALVSCLFFFLR